VQDLILSLIWFCAESEAESDSAAWGQYTLTFEVGFAGDNCKNKLQYNEQIFFTYDCLTVIGKQRLHCFIADCSLSFPGTRH
jgi:hypothetical protein